MTTGEPYPGACDVCKGYWATYAPAAQPVAIGESVEYMAEVWRCRFCGTYWEVGAFSYPQVISREHALKELPDLDAMEAALGIDFPDPPDVPLPD